MPNPIAKDTIFIPRPQQPLSLHYNMAEMDCSPFSFAALPIELQILVFEYYLPEFPTVADLHPVDSPYTLARVCCKWRETVLSTGSLWTTMQIIVAESSRSALRSESILNCLSEWLARSKACPLSARLLYQTDNSRSPTDPVCTRAGALGLRIVALLKEHVDRWHDMVFECPSTLMQPLLDDGGPPKYSQLSAFELNVNNTRSTPRAIDARTLQLPLSRLTQLYLSADYNRLLSMDECLDVLAECPRLLRCAFNLSCDETAVRSRTKPSCNLTYLNVQLRRTIGFHDDHILAIQAFAEFLDALPSDSLTDLVVEWLGHLTPTGVPGLVRALARLVYLENIDLRYLPLTASEVVGVLKALEKLTALALTYSQDPHTSSPVDGSLLRGLNFAGDDGVIPLPQLHSVHIWSHGAHLDEHEIVDFVTPRIRDDGRGLQVFWMEWDKTVGFDEAKLDVPHHNLKMKVGNPYFRSVIRNPFIGTHM